MFFMYEKEYGSIISGWDILKVLNLVFVIFELRFGLFCLGFFR